MKIHIPRPQRNQYWILDSPREINDQPSPCGEIVLTESQPCVLESINIENIID